MIKYEDESLSWLLNILAEIAEDQNEPELAKAARKFAVDERACPHCGVTGQRTF